MSLGNILPMMGDKDSKISTPCDVGVKTRRDGGPGSGPQGGRHPHYVSHIPRELARQKNELKRRGGLTGKYGNDPRGLAMERNEQIQMERARL